MDVFIKTNNEDEPSPHSLKQAPLPPLITWNSWRFGLSCRFGNWARPPGSRPGVTYSVLRRRSIDTALRHPHNQPTRKRSVVRRLRRERSGKRRDFGRMIEYARSISPVLPCRRSVGSNRCPILSSKHASPRTGQSIHCHPVVRCLGEENIALAAPVSRRRSIDDIGTSTLVSFVLVSGRQTH